MPLNTRKMKNKRKRKQIEQSPVVRAFVAINLEYVDKSDVLDTIEDVVATGKFPCLLIDTPEVPADAHSIFIFVRTRWSEHRNMATLVMQKGDGVRTVFHAVNEKQVESFDEEDCPIKPDEFESLPIVEWTVFSKFVYTFASMSFIDLQKRLAGTSTRCLWAGDMKWLHPRLRNFLLKKAMSADPDKLDREIEEFQQLSRNTVEKYREELHNERHKTP